MKHLLIILLMILVWLNMFIWLAKTVDPSTKYRSDVEYNYARFCAGCHGNSGEGNGRIGKFKKLEPAALTDANFWRMHDDEQLLNRIRGGKDDMPAFHYYLNQKEQQEILEYIKNTFQP
ncbi:cytochrome c [Candidatus Poribacteria bacterium]|nr:cytochrome c [Candidatus Poribacteria bacterium]